MYVEFIVILMPMLSLFLGLLQLTYAYVGSAVVKRSANAAVRAAVVVLDDNPAYYGGAPRNSATGARLAVIEEAAMQTLSALAVDVPNAGTVATALGAQGVAGQAQSLDYARGNTRVSFPAGVSAGLESDVTVKIEYKFKCAVPLGRLLLCGADHALDLSAEATLVNQGASYAY